MTTRDDFSGTVDQLLLDAGHTDVPDLRAALLSIASLAEMHAPVPGPELALMLAGPRDELTRQRWLRKHRPAVVGLAVLAGMGLGVSGVAATSQVSGDGAGPWSVQELTTDWSPGWTLPLAPVAADRGGRITWVSPLFLQTDRAHPAAVHAAAEPAAQAADAGDAAVETAAPAASGRDKGQPQIGEGRAPGANGNPGQANHGKATPGKAASGQAVTGRAPDQADEQGAAITPDAVQADAAAAIAGAWELDGMGTAKPGVKIGSTVEAAVDSTVDSALDSVSSWLGKFRR
ncbi:hypothetical protein [Arthrobacter sp. ISL-69]|uniref:hypothetical protein n=1 Tax=Arthrobacter sp. ISL-69 TaxID=2819113 RepID=UPI001BE82272|nr:hypothetical protein [Arthrobacter sp. ISL-69]MBT2537539.1 hypothetical protein [Arthrobacter sp. ISL-69]